MVPTPLLRGNATWFGSQAALSLNTSFQLKSVLQNALLARPVAPECKPFSVIKPTLKLWTAPGLELLLRGHRRNDSD